MAAFVEAMTAQDRDEAATLPPGASDFETLAGHLEPARDGWLRKQTKATLTPLMGSWAHYARAAQRTPPGDWRTWLILAGRGFGKTRTGAEWVMEQVRAHAGCRIALVAATEREAQAVMVEGESGILAVARGDRPEWESSKKRLVWPNGAQAFVYSAEVPESLRGPQHHFAWCDEIAKWRHGPEAWRNLAMGLRLGDQPRTVATTTPRAVALVKTLVAAEQVVTSRGATRDNAAHLAASFVGDLEADYGGTAIGRQELGGELIDEIEGALWSRGLIERCRVASAPALVRTVVGVDPPAGVGGDDCGIVVVALGDDGRAYVIADASVGGASPEGWARAVAAAAEAWRADRVVAEANNGGAMVESVLRAADAGLPVTLVHASTGKAARAEPVQLLYEGARVAHVGAFPELEDELCGLIAGGGYEGPGRSPDRADACVWAVHELMLGRRRPRPAVRVL